MSKRVLFETRTKLQGNTCKRCDCKETPEKYVNVPYSVLLESAFADIVGEQTDLSAGSVDMSSSLCEVNILCC